MPSSGSVRYRDQDLTKADERALTRYRRDNVGFEKAEVLSGLAEGETVILFPTDQIEGGVKVDVTEG